MLGPNPALGRHRGVLLFFLDEREQFLQLRPGRREGGLLVVEQLDPNLVPSIVERRQRRLALHSGALRVAAQCLLLRAQTHMESADDAKEFGAKNKVENVAIVVPEENENGPAAFNISPEAEVTVMIYRDGKVVANHALPKLDEKATASIIKDTSKILK